MCDPVTAFFLVCDVSWREAAGPPQTILQTEANVLVESVPGTAGGILSHILHCIWSGTVAHIGSHTFRRTRSGTARRTRSCTARCIQAHIALRRWSGEEFNWIIGFLNYTQNDFWPGEI